MGNHSLLQSFSDASSGYHGEGKELGGGWEEARQILPWLERQRGTVCVCVDA